MLEREQLEGEILEHVRKKGSRFSVPALFQWLRDLAEEPDEPTPVVKKKETKPLYYLQGEGDIL